MGQQGIFPKEKGSYLLILQLINTKTLQIGKLGEFFFPKGFYVYVGSAMGSGGIAGRVQHHLKPSRHPHWHIDYLKTAADIIEVWSRTTQKRCEHEWATVISKNKGATIPAIGFGSTDCHCDSHLYYFKKKPCFYTFRKRFDPNNMPKHLISVNPFKKGGES